MCDDSTEDDNKRWLADKRLGRREFGALATAAVLVAGCDSSDDDSAADAGDKPAKDAGVATKSSTVDIETPDGKVDAFFVHPETGSHPGVIVWPDILGLRAGFETMAKRLAGEGYAVLVINQYYRTSKAPVFSSWDEWRSDEGKAKLEPMLAKITPAAITSDGAAFVEWLDKQKAVDTKKKIGTSGYCMGGPFTFRTAASQPERVGAFASLHGASLVTETDDSPHLLLPKIKAAALIAIAKNDDERTPTAKTVLKDAAKDAGVAAEIEVYSAQHGWCAIDSTAFDEEQADKAFGRIVALFDKAL